MDRPLSTFPKLSLVNGTAKERLAQTMLLGWFRRYQLDKWLYAETVQIEDGTIPHSHPALTLSPTTPWSDYLADPEQFLAAYLHEQLHWFLVLEEKFEGGNTTQTIIQRVPHYTKIYALVLREHEQVGAVMEAFGLIPDERPPKTKRFVDVRPLLSATNSSQVDR